jgi:DnaJ family protein C protein 7
VHKKVCNPAPSPAKSNKNVEKPTSPPVSTNHNNHNNNKDEHATRNGAFPAQVDVKHDTGASLEQSNGQQEQPKKRANQGNSNAPPVTTTPSVSPAKETTASPGENDEYERLLNRGLELNRSGEYEEAYQELTTAIARFPGNYKLHESRSQSAMLTGRLDVAEKDAQRACDLDPKSLKAKIKLLKVLVRRGALDRAAKLAEAVLAEDPTNAAARSDLQAVKLNVRRLEAARSAFSSGNYREASALALKVTDESPACREALMIRSECLVALGEYDDAYVLTTRILRGDETERRHDHALLNLRAKILFEQERFDQCMKHLSEILRENPDDSAAAKLLKKVKKIQRLKNEGDENFKGSKHKEAYDSYTACLQETDGTGLAQFRSKLFCNRAAALSAMARYEEGIEDCDKAIELDPSYVKAYSRRALCLRALGGKERLERAVFDYEKVEELQGEPTSESRENIRKTKQELKIAKRKNYYELLGITTNESAHTTEDIKKAYKRAALKYHPDRHTNSTEEEKAIAESKFKDVSEALMVLSDPEKRRLYDRGMDLEEIEQRTSQSQHGHGHHHGFHGFDPSMFGGRGFGGHGGYGGDEGFPF